MSGTLNVRWCGPAPCPRDEPFEEVVLVDRPRLEQLDRHPVARSGAEPDLHRPEADRLAAEQDGAAELARQEAQRVGSVGRGERDVVQVVSVGHEAGRLCDAVPGPINGSPRPARVTRFEMNQPMVRVIRPATASMM